jgi:hypothetical protein
MGEWLLSRRDTVIVARHEVPGERCREFPSRRDGRTGRKERGGQEQ